MFLATQVQSASKSSPSAEFLFFKKGAQAPVILSKENGMVISSIGRGSRPASAMEDLQASRALSIRLSRTEM